MWNSPLLILTLVLATLYAALFHLFVGRTLHGLLVAWLAAIVGMAAGQLAALAFSWQGPMIGELNLVASTLGAWLLMFLARWLHL
jgi:uncharacterized membrane protein YeaQ/YmgE (transglycosylase-associated protein family)